MTTAASGYEWRTGATPLTGDRLDELVDAGKLKREEEWSSLLDFETGKRLGRGVEVAAWNPFRRHWIALFADEPGEIWFAEADTPLGPWGYARKVAHHGNYNFYNPSHHPFLDQEGGRLVYFEGTYSTTFSGARAPTPRYDYNQLMYRLALDDARLSLPQAVYRVRGTNGLTHLWLGEQVAAAAAWCRKWRAWFASRCRLPARVQTSCRFMPVGPRVKLSSWHARLPIRSLCSLDGPWRSRQGTVGRRAALWMVPGSDGHAPKQQCRQLLV